MIKCSNQGVESSQGICQRAWCSEYGSSHPSCWLRPCDCIELIPIEWSKLTEWSESLDQGPALRIDKFASTECPFDYIREFIVMPVECKSFRYRHEVALDQLRPSPAIVRMYQTSLENNSMSARPSTPSVRPRLASTIVTSSLRNLELAKSAEWRVTVRLMITHYQSVGVGIQSIGGRYCPHA